MALKEFRENYYFHSGKASDIARQLCFAGIATIWLFKTSSGSSQSIPRELFPPAMLMVLALSLDLMQYIVAAASWGVFNHCSEKAGKKESDEFEAPDQINWLPLVFFWSKLGVTIWASCQLIKFLWFQISPF